MPDHDDKGKESKQKVAVAVKYESVSDIAPKVIASGKGLIADLILELAVDKGIPIYKDQALSELLVKIDVDSTIPLEAYAAVAEILAFVYKTDKELMSKGKRSKSE